MPLAVPWALVTIGTTPWPRTVAVDLPKHLESPMAAPNRHNRAVVSLCDQRGRGSSRAAATKRAATSSKVSRLEPAQLLRCESDGRAVSLGLTGGDGRAHGSPAAVLLGEPPSPRVVVHHKDGAAAGGTADDIRPHRRQAADLGSQQPEGQLRVLCCQLQVGAGTAQLHLTILVDVVEDAQTTAPE